MFYLVFLPVFYWNLSDLQLLCLLKLVDWAYLFIVPSESVLDALFAMFSVWCIFFIICMLLHLASASGLHQYAAAKLLQLHSWLSEPPPPALLLCLDIAFPLRRKYQHHSSRRGFQFNDSNPIKSFWYSTRLCSGTLPRSGDHSTLAYLARKANAPDGLHLSINLKSRHIYNFITDNNLDFLCLTETWQQTNNLSAQWSYPLWVCLHLQTSRDGGLVIIHHKKWKVHSHLCLNSLYEVFQSGFHLHPSTNQNHK